MPLVGVAMPMAVAVGVQQLLLCAPQCCKGLAVHLAMVGYRRLHAALPAVCMRSQAAQVVGNTRVFCQHVLGVLYPMPSP